MVSCHGLHHKCVITEHRAFQKTPQIYSVIMLSSLSPLSFSQSLAVIKKSKDEMQAFDSSWKDKREHIVLEHTKKLQGNLMTWKQNIK